MENISAVTTFILTTYTELEAHRHLYSVCFLITFILIIFANWVLIAAIYIERRLHEPMYLFICSLAVNGLYGSTCLLPSLLNHLLTHNYSISLIHCQLQIFGLHTYGTIEYSILAVMSYDRYVAICHPLHYHILMAPKKACVVITLIVGIPLMYFFLFFIFTIQRTYCDMIITSVYCNYYSLVRLSCFDITIPSLVGLSSFIVSPCSQIVMIVFSYVQILRVCLSSKKSQAKAIQTCTPHILSVINYSVGVFIELIQSSFNMSHVPHKARIFMSLYFLIIPPLCNPVIYGISIQVIRAQLLKLFSGEKISEPH